MQRGNLIYGQSGGVIPVFNNSLAGVVQEARMHSKIDNIYGMVHGIQGFLEENIIDLGRQKSAIIEKLKQTPSSALGSCRYRLGEEAYPRILKILKKYNIRYFIYNGGNDSMDTAQKIDELVKREGYDLCCIGVPKTVDNDLAFTDHCPGYGSVLRWWRATLRDATLDIEAMSTKDVSRVEIFEVMGRDAGWITAGTILAREEPLNPNYPPHLIYLPEIPYNEVFFGEVEHVIRQHNFAVICVSEGLRDKEGRILSESKSDVDTDTFGHKQLGGVGDFLAEIVKERLKVKARSNKPGIIQRCSGILASSVDREEAYRLGAASVRYAIQGYSGYMVNLKRLSDQPYECDIGIVELSKVANAVRKFPRDFICKMGNGVAPEFIRYSRPLIGEPLPSYPQLQKIRVNV